MTFEWSLILRATGILGCAGLLSLLLRHASAAARHAVWALGFWGILALPFVSIVFPAIELPLLPQYETRTDGEPTQIAPREAVTMRDVVPVESIGVASLSHTPPPRRTSQWIGREGFALLWGLGSLILIARALVGAWQVRQLKRRSVVANSFPWNDRLERLRSEMDIARSVELRIACDSVSPMTWGILRSVILLPAAAVDWSDQRCRLVLAHELAHVQRRDGFIQVFVQAACSLYWCNPIVWYAARRLRVERERACDDRVLILGADAEDYADHLLQITRDINSSLSFATVTMAHPSQLRVRLMAILDSRMQRCRLSRVAAMTLAGMTLCLTVFAALIQITSLSALALPAFLGPPPAIVEPARELFQAVTPTSSVAPTPNSIEGIVVRFGTTEPISEVDVELRRVEGTPTSPLLPLVFPPGNFGPGAVVRATYPNPADIGNVRTKADGRFAFTNLKPGLYRLQAARAGGAYYPAEYGQRGPKGRGYDFEFVEGQSMRDVRLQMAPTGSIVGRVMDADGQPAARVRVMALESTYSSTGGRTLGIIQAVQTDDKGEYRLFWLPPGQYVVAARPEDPRRQTLQLFITPPGSTDGFETYPQAPLMYRTLEDGTVVEETFDVVYYGGDPDVRKARSIDLRPGATVSGIDLLLAADRVRTRHVRGRVIDPSRANVPGVAVTALPRNAGPSMVAPAALSNENGAFELVGVGAGSYVLRASIPGINGFAVLGPGDTDVEGLTITMSLGVRVQGRLVVDGRAPGAASPDLSRINVRLENALPGLPGSSSGAVNGDSFTVSVSQPGDYRVLVSPLLVPYLADPSRRPTIPPELRNAYIKAIRLNADDGLAGTVNVAAAQPGQLEIVIALNGGTVQGVVNDRQLSAPNATVVLVPAARSRLDLYKVVNSGSNGRFRIEGIPPGEYKLFAWEYVEDGAWFDSEFQRTQESKGKTVRITEGSSSETSLTMERP